MNPEAVITCLGLATAVAWGLSDFFAAKSAKTVGPLMGAALVYCGVALGSVLLYLTVLHVPWVITTPGAIYAAAAGALTILAAIALFVGLNAGPVSIVSPLSSTYPAITTLAALLLFHAQLTALQIVGISLVVCGVSLASGLLAAAPGWPRLTKGPILGMLAALLFGLGFAAEAQAIRVIPWQVDWVIANLVSVVMLLTVLGLANKEEAMSAKAVLTGLKNVFVVATMLLSLVGFLAFSYGISKSVTSGGSVMAALSASYPLLTIFLALKHFNEKVHVLPFVGAVIGVIGVVVLSVG